MGRRIFIGVVCAALLPVAVFGAFSLKKKEIKCEDVKPGIGYYLHFMKENPGGLESLDKEAADKSADMTHKAAAAVLTVDFSSAADMSQPPYSLDPAKVVKMKAMGMAYDFDYKLMASSAKGREIKYALAIFSYASNFGPKEGTKNSDMAFEELPTLDLDDGGAVFKAFNFISLRAALVDLTEAKEAALTKEKLYSYREWFIKKYPDFMAGKTNELPEGVSYNAVSQYQLFIQDSMADLLTGMPEYQTMLGCKEEKK